MDFVKFQPTIDHERCKNCQLCVSFCPKQVITVSSDKDALPEVTDPQACIGCRQCEKYCPDFAIKVKTITNPSLKTTKNQDE
ncbi:MAG: 4Fe-4S dicluster domain-containing protein [Candidatus Pacebacteria bacterium]|nr:4Fe-4S dicluster domain-containing protein [Candidatus Paceibacterota bacterium]